MPIKISPIQSCLGSGWIANATPHSFVIDFSATNDVSCLSATFVHRMNETLNIYELRWIDILV